MEARLTKAAQSAAVRRTAALAILLLVAMGARQRTDNFVIETPDPNFAQQLAQAAEKFRHDLAIEWLGKPMPNWAQPCVMTVQVGPHLGAGGATTFVFDHGEVFGWRMTIQGSSERLLDSVLPHEVTHMIFASHFRQPLPRWADEGGATSVEHASERNKYLQMLNQFLRTGHGIAFNQMFAMTDYPADMMPLYAQGYSLAEYLIETGGRRKYVEFLGDGLKNDDWAGAVQRHYGAKDLSALQNTWLAWVKQGSPTLAPREAKPSVPSREMLVANQRRPRPEPNLIYHVGNEQAPAAPTAQASDEQASAGSSAKLIPVHIPSSPEASLASEEKQGETAVAAAAPVRRTVSPSSWSDPSRVVSSPAAPVAVNDPRGKSSVPPASGWHAPGEPAATAIAAPSAPPSVDPFRTQVTHPQPSEQPRQSVLQ